MRVTAITASMIDVEFCWLVDANAIEGKDYDINRLTQFWEITDEQDGQLCENNFRGIETNDYRSGRRPGNKFCRVVCGGDEEGIRSRIIFL